VDDAPLVQVLQRLAQLRDEVRRVRGVYAAPVAERPQLAARHELEAEVERGGVLEGVVQPDDGGVVSVREHVLLDDDLVRLVVAVHLCLVDNLERHLLLRRSHRCLDDLRVVSIAQQPARIEVVQTKYAADAREARRPCRCG